MTFACLLFAVAQDGAEIRELIRRLGDPDFEVREEAERRLIGIGAPAVGGLRGAAAGSEDPEIQHRAGRILTEIERIARVNREMGMPSRVTVRRTAPLRRLFEGLTDFGAIDSQGVAGTLDAEASIQVTDGTGFDVLDSICRSLGGRISYRIEGGRVRFLAEPFVARPAFHHDAFRVRIAALDRTSVDGRFALALRLEADVLPAVSVFGEPTITVMRVIDDEGRAAAARGPLWVFDGEPRRLPSVQGSVAFYARAWSREIRFEGGAGHKEIGTGVATLARDRAAANRLELRLVPNGIRVLPESVLAGLVESGVVVLEGGEERPLEVAFARMDLGHVMHLAGIDRRIEESVQGRTLVFRLDCGPGVVKEVRLRISGAVRLEVPFEIRDAELR
ncbi:MAG TPA: hypothetical protein VI643_01615 [Planctomycetota bacterium]|nr:hypothetical protein [Planctomycetota bacterium]